MCSSKERNPDSRLFGQGGNCHDPFLDNQAANPLSYLLSVTRDQILFQLEALRNRVNDAIAALRGERHRRRLSAAARRKISFAQKRRWARQKKRGS